MGITVRDALRDAERRLSSAGIDEARREAGWLLAHLLGTSAGALRLRAGEPHTAIAEYDELLRRRELREPLQYILGSEEFMGLTFQVTPAVLIPRFDTEVVVRAALSELHGCVRIADIGTGSGVIAIALAHRLPQAEVIAVDISPEALAVAAGNAKAHGVADRVTFRQGDLLSPLAGERLDAIVSNPPYIRADEIPDLMPEVRDWEPRLALSPGPDGLACYRELARQAGGYLQSGGQLAVEVGAGQAAAVQRMFAEAGFVTSVYPDTAGIPRAVVGRLV